MTAQLPQLYFRMRETGAIVFRLDGENRNRSLELRQIAVVNTNRGDYRAHADETLHPSEQAEIEAWLLKRRAQLDTRKSAEMARTVEQINLTAQWAQSQATEDELAALTDDLLLAMHDLRHVLLRKKADRLDRSD